MLKICLQRIGKKHEPHYRIVIMEKTSSPKSGKVKEVVGHYHPHLKDAEQCVLQEDRIQHWIGVGAQPSETVASFLKKSSN